MDWIRSLSGWIHSRKVAKRAEIRAALTSLVEAATKTRQYIADLRTSPGNHSLEAERKLADLWARVGTDAMSIDQDFASRCILKADYWSDPVGWTEQQKNDRLINLDDMLRVGTQALLENWPSCLSWRR